MHRTTQPAHMAPSPAAAGHATAVGPAGYSRPHEGEGEVEDVEEQGREAGAEGGARRRHGGRGGALAPLAGAAAGLAAAVTGKGHRRRRHGQDKDKDKDKAEEASSSPSSSSSSDEDYDQKVSVIVRLTPLQAPAMMQRYGYFGRHLEAQLVARCPDLVRRATCQLPTATLTANGQLPTAICQLPTARCGTTTRRCWGCVPRSAGAWWWIAPYACFCEGRRTPACERTALDLATRTHASMQTRSAVPHRTANTILRLSFSLVLLNLSAMKFSGLYHRPVRFVAIATLLFAARR